MKANTVTIGIVMIVVFGAGFMTGRLTSFDGTVFKATDESQNAATGEADENVSTQNSESIPGDAGTEVKANALTEGQRALLESFGINADEITITPEMIACAEAELGSSRIEEIKGGATPSFTEGVKLVACYE